ncbi:MAG: hypothetical protein MZV63_08315 [Marinilabiliales bacterium]|nr:hypothetical protein [Marinilabiliales bacterium]
MTSLMVSGDRTASILTYLYDAYYEVIRDHLKKNSGSDDDVYDVLQEAVVILYKQVTGDGFKLTADLKGYFFGMARNIWNAQLRYRSRLTSLETDPGRLRDEPEDIYHRNTREDCDQVICTAEGGLPDGA